MPAAGVLDGEDDGDGGGGGHGGDGDVAGGVVERGPDDGCADHGDGHEGDEGAGGGGDAFAAFEAEPEGVVVAENGCHRGEDGDERGFGKAGAWRRRAGTRPLRKSRTKTATPSGLPKVRRTLVAPMLPLPTLRISTPRIFPAMKPNGVAPMM